MATAVVKWEARFEVRQSDEKPWKTVAWPIDARGKNAYAEEIFWGMQRDPVSKIKHLLVGSMSFLSVAAWFFIEGVFGRVWRFGMAGCIERICSQWTKKRIFKRDVIKFCTGHYIYRALHFT